MLGKMIAIMLPTEARKGLAHKHNEALMVQMGPADEPGKPVLF